MELFIDSQIDSTHLTTNSKVNQMMQIVSIRKNGFCISFVPMIVSLIVSLITSFWVKFGTVSKQNITIDRRMMKMLVMATMRAARELSGCSNKSQIFFWSACCGKTLSFSFTKPSSTLLDLFKNGQWKIQTVIRELERRKWFIQLNWLAVIVSAHKSLHGFIGHIDRVWSSMSR